MKVLVSIFLLCALHVSSAAQNFDKWWAAAYSRKGGEKGAVLMDIYPVASRYSKLEQEANKMAVFAMMFIGLMDENDSIVVPPIINNKDVLKTNKDFFKRFFAKNGPYLKYVSLVNSPGQFELVKVRGKGWKIGYTVSLYDMKLEEDLRMAKIISN